MRYDPMLIIKDDKLKDKDYVDKPRILIVGPAKPSTGGIFRILMICFPHN